MSPISAVAVVFREYGEPLDVLVEEHVKVADPHAGGVRIRVAAAGLNPADRELCRGFLAGQLPRGIGYDVAGTIDAVGVDVADFSRGDLVFGTADFVGQPSAGLAEFAVLDSWYLVPDGLDPVKAAVLPMALQTATWTLDAMGLQPGNTLLVNGAGGTVGFAATQIALRRGARVIATAGPTLTADLESFGAKVTTYGAGMVGRVRELAGEAVDLVLDAAPPKTGTISELIAATSEPARVMTISNHDEARTLGARVNLDHLSQGAPASTFLPEYAALTATGRFGIPIARTYPLAQWLDAVELLTSGHPHGKVVIRP